MQSFVPQIPGVTGIVLFPFLFLLEMIGVAVKPFALAIRLFANMMAGHIVLASLLLLIPVIKGLSEVGIAAPTIVGCAALNCLELFVAFLQAYIFTFLTCMFIGAAVSPEH
jgi:F-type H+-transporting ATPase subunit a